MAKSALERAEDVASERKRASSAELVELVRAVNPTGRELPAKIESERYRLKSRLQSLLVLRFGAELDVERTDDPAVVGLRHRATGADACHARIDDLDDEARSWVRFQLDTAGSEESRGSSAGSTRPRDDAHARRDALDPLSQGRRALEEYDFDGAREAFERALRDGMQDAGVALLEMLVDSLADFAAAIALEPRLGKLNGRSATLLALAHARSGARAEARRRVDALDDPRVPDVWAALVSSALAEGPLALDEATTFAREARERNVRHPELIEAEVTLARRLAERRAPEEAALRESWARGDEADAERIARAIGGPEAGRILQELDRRRNDAEGRRLLEEARESFAAGGDPAALVRRAAERGVRDESLDTAIATRAAASAERAREERADWITAHLAERVGLRAPRPS